MNKNKLFFLILALVVVVLLVLFAWLIWKWNKSDSWAGQANIKIWVVKDNKENFLKYLDTFKDKNPQYKSIVFDVVSFWTYQEYFYSLIWSFLVWNGPDLFVLNNNDSWFLDNQTLPIETTAINIDNFRQNFEPIFSSELIISKDDNWNKFEYLKWIPLWFESLWLYYNFLYLKWKKLNTWSYLNDAISNLKNVNGFQTILWIGNWTTVQESVDILTQLFVLDNVFWLKKLDIKTVESVIASYFKFWDINQENWYNYFFEEQSKSKINNIDLFSRGDIQMVFGYPSLIEEIDKKWFNKSFLRATNFPTFSEKSGKILVNYNYFVINKNTKYPNFSKELLWYFSSNEWQRAYLDLFPYYLSPNLEVWKTRLEENLKDWYFVKYKDFYNPNLEFTSFNKWYKVIYDSEIPSILDNWLNWIETFEKFKKRILCLSDKMISQQNLWTPCE